MTRSKLLLKQLLLSWLAAINILLIVIVYRATRTQCLFEILTLRRGISHVSDCHFDFNAVIVDVCTAWVSYTFVFKTFCGIFLYIFFSAYFCVRSAY